MLKLAGAMVAAGSAIALGFVFRRFDGRGAASAKEPVPSSEKADEDADLYAREYWVYQNWRARGHRAVIHASDCSFCNAGRGLQSGTRSDNGAWHGPFNRFAKADAFAHTVGGAITQHSCI